MVVTSSAQCYIYVQSIPARNRLAQAALSRPVAPMAKNNLPKGIHVVVFVNDDATLIMPTRHAARPDEPTDVISVRRNGASATR